MRLVVNGEAKEVPEGLSVADLLATLGIAPTGVAVEVNEAIVRRARHAEHRLSKEDKVEIVTFVGGG